MQDENAGGWQSVGLPFGPKPRVILSYLNATAIRTGSPEIEVEDSLTAFVKRIGLASKGKNMLVVKDQLARLSTAEVRMSLRYEENRQRQVQTHIVAGFDLWFPKDRRQRVLWPSTVRLSSTTSSACNTMPYRLTSGRLPLSRIRPWGWTYTRGWLRGSTG